MGILFSRGVIAFPCCLFVCLFVCFCVFCSSFFLLAIRLVGVFFSYFLLLFFFSFFFFFVLAAVPQSADFKIQT